MSQVPPTVNGEKPEDETAEPVVATVASAAQASSNDADEPTQAASPDGREDPARAASSDEDRSLEQDSAADEAVSGSSDEATRIEDSALEATSPPEPRDALPAVAEGAEPREPGHMMAASPTSTEAELEIEDEEADGPGDLAAVAMPAEEEVPAAAAEKAPADDSLEAILLEAGSRPQPPLPNKGIGTQTLMGVGIDGLDLASFRAGLGGSGTGAQKSAVADTGGELAIDVDLDGDAAGLRSASGAQARAGAEANTPALIESKLTSELAGADGGRGTISLLDEVVQALDAQAAEYRDRARGRLPGMPVSGPIAVGSRSPSPGERSEFEEADEGQRTSLTPAIISVVEEDADEVTVLADDPTQKIASGPSPSIIVGTPDGPRTDNRPTLKMPPVPGLSVVPGMPTFGPPPGAGPRPTTPAAGLPVGASGRVRLPTPGPGMGTATLPPPSGRLTLPPGTMINPAVTGRTRDLTDTMPATPMSIESSRRNTGGVAVGRGSGRVAMRGSARLTEPVIHARPSSMKAMKALLSAHVKLATVNLAGLIAVTFAGGLFVGMLVQGRNEPATAAHIAATAPGVADTAAGEVPKRSGVAAVAGAATGAAAASTTKASPEAASANAPSAGAAAASKDPMVAPLPSATTPAAEPDVTAARKVAVTNARVAARPRRAVAPAVTASSGPAAVDGSAQPPTAGKTAGAAAAAGKSAAAATAAVAAVGKTAAAPAKAPALRPAALTTSATSKPVATNAGGKPAPKSKVKPAWHDPFAD